MLRFLCAAMAGAAFIASSCIGPVHAADEPEKAPAPVKPVNVPLFLVNDNRLTYACQFTATDPVVPGKTAKQIFAFTHFDAWQYGTNLINLTLLKSDHNDPASPCPIFGTGCAGEVEFYRLIRRTFGWNEIFNTKPSLSALCETSRLRSASMARPQMLSTRPTNGTSSLDCSLLSICPIKATSTSLLCRGATNPAKLTPVVRYPDGATDFSTSPNLPV
jgi:hypothetical protein